MYPKFDARELLQRARKSGHDALGIAHDPEALRLLADAGRERFLQSGDAQGLERWVHFVADLAAFDGLSADAREWLLMQLVLLRTLPPKICGPTRLTAISQHLANSESAGLVSDDARRLLDGLARSVSPASAASLLQDFARLVRLRTGPQVVA